MNRFKKSSGSKFSWKPAHSPSMTQTLGAQKPATPTQSKKSAKAPLKKEKPAPPIFPKTLNTYLGPRGYTILKSELTDSQIADLRRELTVRPATGAVGYGAPTDAVEYPIYRESPNKLYLPRFFGEREFGPVKKLAISGGEDISVPFAGGLRPIQVPVVAAYMAAVSSDMGGGGLLELPCAFGKTVLSLKIIAELGKKTLVIVNKEFLLNQWVERIGQFLPTARVGRIQGPEIDIDDKDIVIGMLQSISMKDYDAKVFESFGLTIIDEVHHISSEVFSRALFKIVSKYMLGLSATMERKDGTTYVFKQFLGEVVFKGERDEEHDVEVRAIEFVSKDAEFNTVEYDFRGNPKYSTMIVKLCDYVERSDFIVRIIADLLKEQPGAQIMILAHNRSILTYLHDAIQDRRIATVGYYVGGMREASLKATEDKQVVVATYAMAAEALDIKTLNTLVMVTPKTDIVQSVGRILREKHEKPIVIDIVDKHDVFQNQWAKRRRYYKKCEYTIRAIDSERYAGFSEDKMRAWKLVYRSAAKNKKCVVAIESDSSDNHLDDEDDEQPQKPTGPKKCMVHLDGIEEDDPK
jgi:superfamily II DNA or RNA helicase